MKEPLILTFDCGTQSTRAILFNRNGDIIGKEKIMFTPYFSLQEGWAEQKAELYWDKMIEAAQGLRKKCPEEWANVIAISVTAMRDNCVCLDKDLKPLRPVILWLDRREATPKMVKIPMAKKLILKAVGMYEPMFKQVLVTPSNWIREFEPNIWEKTCKYVLLSAYLNYLLTGRLCDSLANAVGHIPFDYKNQCWMKPSALTFPAFAVPTEKLCELLPPSEKIGGLTKEVAQLFNLPEGLPVIAGGADKSCETLGTGVLGDGAASLSFGTTATVQITTKKYVEPSVFMPAYPAVMKGRYNPEVQIFRGYWMITWFKEQFSHKEQIEAEKRGIPTEVLLDKMLSRVPVGSDGLVMQPFWSPILKAPEARGSMLGFTDFHTREHMYRAIIEGIGFGLMEGLREMEKRSGYTVKYLTVSGGGSSSDAICQITADMFGLPIKRVQTHETSSLGAAMIGFVGMGIYNSIEEAVEKMVHYSEVFMPDLANTSIYSELFERVYKKIYRQVQPLFFDIKSILSKNRR